LIIPGASAACAGFDSVSNIRRAEKGYRLRQSSGRLIAAFVPMLMSLEILNRLFVFLGRSFRLEGAEIPAFACFRILLP
jgi:hypothetical protein